MTSATRFTLLAAGSAALLALTGCAANNNDANIDLVAGKKLFVQKCGSCHVLARAGTSGSTGPNLDHAFANPVAEGFGETAIRGMVRQMIDIGPAKVGDKVVMQPDIVEGNDAKNVAAYVARSVDKPGKDTGLLNLQSAQSSKPAVAQAGKLTIPAAPTGDLLFVNKTAEAPAGRLTVEMPNTSGTPHDIVIDGKGEGEVVTDGTSTFSADFTAGKYTYYCSVPGHKATMSGTLTVK
jgi:mono/diheme cytochrome c family protein